MHWFDLAIHNMTVDAQVASPSDPVCPGNRVIFTCQQGGAFARWTIYLPTGQTLQQPAQNSRYGSVETFMNDPGYIFEIHVLSNSSSASITSELQVTAVRELNGVRVECFGPNGTMMYTINVASVGEFIMAILVTIIIIIPQLPFINKICRSSSSSKWSHGNQ
jgi:hypothetical protein